MKEEISTDLRISTGLQGFKDKELFFPQLDFLARLTPEERTFYKEELHETLTHAQEAISNEDNHASMTISSLLDFYRKLSPKERTSKQYSAHLDKFVSNTLEQEENSHHLITFYCGLPETELTADIRKKVGHFFMNASCESILEIALKATPETKTLYSDQIDSALEEMYLANDSSHYHIFLQYTAHLSQDKKDPYREHIDNIIKEYYLETDDLHSQGFLLKYHYSGISKEERELLDADFYVYLERMVQANPEHVLDFFSALTPEERSQQRSTIERLLNTYIAQCASGSTDENFGFSLATYLGGISESEKKDPLHVQARAALFGSAYEHEYSFAYYLGYYQECQPEERQISQESRVQARDLDRELVVEIGDKGLRRKYIEHLSRHISSQSTSIVALHSATQKKHLGLAIGLEALGSDPLPSRTWKLSTAQRSELHAKLAGLMDLDDPHLLSDLSLPFRPREGSSAAFEERMTEWISLLDALAKLGTNLGESNVLYNHLEALSTYQKSPDNQDLSSPSYSLIKNIFKEITRARAQIVKLFKESVGIEHINAEQFHTFAERWNNEINSIIILSSRLDDYAEVKSLLSTIVLSEIQGLTPEHRYNVDDPLITEQLNPLLAGQPQERHSAIINGYHEGVRLLTTIDKEHTVTKQKTAFQFDEELSERLSSDLVQHDHLSQIFSLEVCETLSDDQKQRLKDFVASPLAPEVTPEITNPNTFFSEYAHYIPHEYLVALVKIRQLFKDLTGGEKTAESLKSGIDRLTTTLPDDVKQLAFVKRDIGEFLSSHIGAQAGSEVREITNKKQYLVSFTTDHPKLLLEIGKYPANSGSCQNYEYDAIEFPVSLPGYVRDAHIQAIVVCELVTDEEPLEILSIDEGRSLVTALFPPNTKRTVKMDKPVARSMIFLGSKNDQGVFVHQQDYSEPGAIEKKTARSIEESTLDALIDKLNDDHDLSLRKRNSDEKGIMIAGSHNSEGHYNDIASDQMGHNGESYELFEK